MKKFDMKRFGLVARWTFRMDRKELLTSACVMVFVYLFMAFMFFWPVIKGEFHATSITISNVVSLQFSAYLIYVVIGGAYVFNNMTAKTGRLAFMMLPAKMKNGMAIRVKTEMPVKVRCEPVCSIMLKSRALAPARIEDIAMAIQIGTPKIRSTIIVIAMISATVIVIYLS